MNQSSSPYSNATDFDPYRTVETPRSKRLARYIVGLDLGEVRDFSAICIISTENKDKYSVVGLLRVKGDDCEGLLKYGSQSEGFYPRLAKLLTEKLLSPPLLNQCALVIDGSGPGRQITKSILSGKLAKSRTPITPLIIRAYDNRTFQGNDGFVRVSRVDLVSHLAQKLDSRSLVIPAGLPHLEDLKKELAMLQGRETRKGSTTKEHDDMAIALSMCVWLADNLKNSGTAGIRAVSYAN